MADHLEIPFPPTADMATLIFHRLGVMEGKLDGVLASLNAISAENIRCDEDRQTIKKDLDGLRGKQYWLAGVATGAGFFLSKITGMFGIPTPHP